jgi:hypothetical protein
VDAIERVLRRQSGVVSRSQALSSGADPTWVARRLRRREWVVLHDGVYVDHTGEPTRRQREWAALLLHPGSVLAGRSALVAHGLDLRLRPRDPVELAIPHGRAPRPRPGMVVVQLRGFEAAVLPRTSPPRLRVEHAAVLVASRASSEDAAVAVLADVLREGLTTPWRLEAVLDELSRLPRRALLREVVTEVERGAESPLERRYLRDVERRHALPRGDRQVLVRTGGGHRLRDVRYPAYRTIIELDGRLGHTAALDRWADLGRDLEAAAQGEQTLRAGWQQVLEPCRLAGVVGRVLASRGWLDRARPCRSPFCAIRLEDVA